MIKFFTGVQPLEVGETGPEAMLDRVRALDSSDAIDRVLVGYSATWPHNHATAPFALAASSRFSPIVAHRPGVMHPVAAARLFATMDILGGGRLALNVVVGGSDKDLRREGDYTAKSDRYARAAEYLDVMNRAWSSDRPFDHDGKYFHAENVRLLTRPSNGHIPIYMGGESDDAVDFGARSADLYMLWGEPVAGTRERIERVRKAADGYHRDMDFSLSLRLFVGDTEDDAWSRARAVEREVLEAQGTNRFLRSSSTDASVGRERQLALTEDELHDTCFWTGLTKLLGGFANSAALVGTEDQILESLARYRDVGVSTFLITTGSEAAWHPDLEDLLLRAKKEL